MASSSSSSSQPATNLTSSTNSGARSSNDDSRPLFFPLSTLMLILVFAATRTEMAYDSLSALAYYCDMTPRNTFFLVIAVFVVIAIVANYVLYYLRESAKAKEEKKINDDMLAIERAALVDIFNASNGKRWKDKTRWCTDEPIERWHGVKVDKLGKTNRVTKIILAENNLTGTLSPSIGKLQYLNEVDFRQNFLEGEIPKELGNCEVLEGVYLSDNRFTGKIPRNLFKLPYLMGLYCYNNLFDDKEKKSARKDLEKCMKDNPNFILHPANI